MTRLSVNINKIATLRNSRGGNTPDLLQAVRRIEHFGAHGITVHPRPDGRHVRYDDVRALRPILTTEFNIEGYPSPSFLDLVCEVMPDQVTLVPDPPEAITSNAGWDTIAHRDFLRETSARLQAQGMRVSLFVEADPRMVEAAVATGANRVELYTEAYALGYGKGNDLPAAERAIAPFIAAAETAFDCGLGVNAGHDLSLDNIVYFARHIPGLLEVSIGHALISESLYLGMEHTISLYLEKLTEAHAR